MFLLICLGLIYFFASACQDLARNFKGSKESILTWLNLSFMVGFVSFVVCFVWSFFVLTWWVPIVAFVVVSIISGILQGFLKVIYMRDVYAYAAYAYICMVGVVLSTMLCIIPLSNATTVGYNVLELYNLSDFFDYHDAFSMYKHEIIMCAILFVSMLFLIISSYRLYKVGEKYDEKKSLFIAKHFKCLSLVGMSGCVAGFILATNLYSPFIVVYIVGYIVSGIVAFILSEVTFEKIEDDEMIVIAFWDAITIILSMIAGGYAVLNT